MKKLKFLLLLGFALTGMKVAAQGDYNLSEQYLKNAGFDTDFDCDINATGRQVVKVSVPTGWKQAPESTTTRAFGITMQYGTQRTVQYYTVPQTDANGNNEGGFLVLGASLKDEVTFCQTLKLPAGHYKLATTYYNINPDANGGASRLAWIGEDGNEVRSEVDSFEYGKWITDTISFELTEVTKGQVRIGFQSIGGSAVKSAIIAVDYVTLMRDTPYGEADTSIPQVEVTADSRFARGATMAFGRILNIEGEDIVEQGFCWAEHPNPTLADNHTTNHLSNNGTIYWIKDLKPATRYYMCAYATNANGQTGYSTDIKFYTIPMGKVDYWYNNGGSDAEDKRINDAATNACNIFNNLTSIRKHFNIGYSAGTPTADCYYADEPWMNMGANASYQRTGTIMHEMQHGMGVIPYTTQWYKNILRENLDGSGRGTGHWLGERVSEFLDFWDNTTGSQLNGDYQHMWPYGINGAHEDNGSNELYFANAMIGQALGEDGLEHNYQTFAEPYYAFNQEDTIKYYLKCENQQRGRETAFLMPDENGELKWNALSTADAVRNDAAAWYITFTPANQHYQLRNAATGQYMTYNNQAFKTTEKASPSVNEDFHLMRGRVDIGKLKLRGYWMIHPQDSWDPVCLAATNNGSTTAAVFNLANNASAQRWLILTEKELQAFDLANGINDIATAKETPTRRQQGVFSLDGRKIADDASALPELPWGIYIVEGRKVVIGGK